MKAIVLACLVCMATSAGWSQVTLIDFETFPDGMQVPNRSGSLSNQWQEFGLFISDSTPEDGASAYTGVANLPAHSGTRAVSDSAGTPGKFLVFTFFVPDTGGPGVVEQAGLWVQNNDTQGSVITFLAPDGSVLNTVHTSTNHTLEMFVSYSDPSGIAAVRIDDPDYFIVDDVQFGPVSGVPVETQKIRRGQIVACWPAAYAGYSLQVTKHINKRRREKTKWKIVDAAPVLNGDSLCVTNPVAKGKFFRLVAP